MNECVRDTVGFLMYGKNISLLTCSLLTNRMGCVFRMIVKAWNTKKGTDSAAELKRIAEKYG